MFRAIIFDKDATLYRSARMEQAWMRAMRRIFPSMGPDYARRVKTETWRTLETSLARDSSLSRDAFRRERERLWHLQTPFPGIKEYLEDMPLIKVVCTADDRLATERQMTRDGLRVTTMCCGDDDGVADKPDPAGVLRLLADMGVCASEACVVGDSVCDMELKSTAGLGGAIFVDATGQADLPPDADARVRRTVDITLDMLSELAHAKLGDSSETKVPLVRAGVVTPTYVKPAVVRTSHYHTKGQPGNGGTPRDT